MNKIIFTGTSSGYPSKTRACSSFVIKSVAKLYQFDAGEGVSGSIQRCKLDANEIDRIFISHLHPDHITGLFLELQMMYLDNRKKPLNIYIPREATKGLEKTVDLFYLFRGKFPFKFDFLPIGSNPVFRGKEITVNAYPNLHLAGNKPVIKKCRKSNKMQSFSYIIRCEGKNVLYSGDLTEQDDIGGLLKGIHTAIVEGLHVDLQSLFRACMTRKVKRLVLTHLPDETLKKPRRILKIAEKAGFKQPIIAFDGLQLKI
ncbi:MAG: MBL fold metallo-hydrolase [candidate division Zixibacteria bacterium]|nr:MBL fold metallo-hydrolase [candidate division Zixibacteria bacterium]